MLAPLHLGVNGLLRFALAAALLAIVLATLSVCPHVVHTCADASMTEGSSHVHQSAVRWIKGTHRFAVESPLISLSAAIVEPVRAFAISATATQPPEGATPLRI